MCILAMCSRVNLRGDVVRSSINIYNSGCMLAMKDMPDNAYDLAIVDPPYGIGADKAQNQAAESRIKAQGKSKAGRGWKQYKDTEWDKDIPKKEYWNNLFRVSKNQIVCGGNYMTEHLKPSMGWIVWDKGQRDFSLADGELLWTSFDKALRIFTYSRAKALHEKKDFGERHHPTQKPVALYKWLLQNYAKEGDKILDTHLGSGSIALACWDLCFDLTGYEIDREYYDNAILRLDRHKSQGQLF